MQRHAEFLEAFSKSAMNSLPPSTWMERAAARCQMCLS